MRTQGWLPLFGRASSAQRRKRREATGVHPVSPSGPGVSLTLCQLLSASGFQACELRPSVQIQSRQLPFSLIPAVAGLACYETSSELTSWGRKPTHPLTPGCRLPTQLGRCRRRPDLRSLCPGKQQCQHPLLSPANFICNSNNSTWSNGW